MRCMQEDNDEKFKSNISHANTKEEKVLVIFNIFLNDKKEIKIQREIYKLFLLSCLNNNDSVLKSYNNKIRNKYILIIDTILNNKESSSKVYDTVIGLFLSSLTLEEYDLKDSIMNYLKNEFKLINNIK